MNRIQKLKKLSPATVELLVSEGPSVATARIAKAAGISNGSLFNLLPNKQAILDETYRSIKFELLSATERDARLDDKAYFRALWGGYVQWGLANRARHAAMVLLFHSELISVATKAEVDHWFAPVGVEIAQRLASGPYRIQNAQAYNGAVIATLDHIIAQEFTTELIDQVFDLLWFGNLIKN